MSCFIIDQKEYAKAAELFNLLARNKKMEVSKEKIDNGMKCLYEINYEAYNYRYEEENVCPQWIPSSLINNAMLKEKFNKIAKQLLCSKLFNFLRCVRYQCSEGDYGEKAVPYLYFFFNILLNYLTVDTNDWGEIEL